MLECLKGSISSLIPYILNTCLSQLSLANNMQEYQVYIYQTISMCFYNDPDTAVKHLNDSGSLAGVFQQLINYGQGRLCEVEIRRLMFGLSALLNC